MSRLAYYPTPATRRLGSFTLDACPPTFRNVSFTHDFTDCKAMVRQPRPLGGRSWHRPCFRTGIAATCCTPFLLNGFSLASLRDAEGEKHPASQDTCGVSLATLQFLPPIVYPSTAQRLLRRQDPSLGQAILDAAFLRA